MATRKITDTADDIAQGVSRAGRRAGSRVRRSGAKAAGKVETAANESASTIRRSARRTARSYDSVAADVDGHVATIEDTIRANPLAAAGAALLVGVFLGRFIL